jgi:glycosyltransferase involved in cell wall biosynthesis
MGGEAKLPRVAMFHPSFDTPGGAETLCIEEAEALRRAGDDVTIVTMRFDEDRWRPLVAGFPVVVTPRLKSYWTDVFRGATRSARRRHRYRRVTRPLRGFDVVLAHNYPCNSLLGASDIPRRKVWQCNEPPRFLHFRAANPTFYAWVTSLGPDEGGEKARLAREKLAAELERAESLAEKARFDVEETSNLDHIFAISEFSRDNARRIYGRCGDEVVYPVVRFPERGRARTGLDRNGPGVLVVSRLELPKNVDTVVRGFAEFRAGHPGATLHVIGDGPARGMLEALAGSLLPEGAFAFHGYVPDERVREISDRCEIFALLPVDEPFGLVYPEAAARGLLLVGPDHGGPLEILDGGRLGRCVDAFDPKALADALAELASLPDAEADRLREAADRACRARYERSVVGPQLRRVLLNGR